MLEIPTFESDGADFGTDTVLRIAIFDRNQSVGLLN
jgi:hypothetical protein